MIIFAYLLLIWAVQSSVQSSPPLKDKTVVTNSVEGTLPFGGLDFVQYYAALALLFDGQNPYDGNLAAMRQMAYGRGWGVPMFAPPWGLLPALLVIGLPFPLANIAYVTLNALLLIFCVTCWTLLLFPGRIRYLPFTVLAAFLWDPSFLDLSFGQNSLWPLAGFTGWLWFTTRNKPIPAGLFLALTIIKPHLGLLPGVFAGVYLLRQRNWTTIASFLLSFIAATLVTICLRSTIWFEYRSAVETGPAILGYRSHTLHFILYPYAGASLKYFSYGIWFSVIFFAALRTWNRFGQNADLHVLHSGIFSPHPLTIWSLFICLLVIPSLPYAWHHDFVFMLPGLILAMGFYLGNKPQGFFGLILWVFMEVWCVLSWVYHHDGFFLVPWMGLTATIWLMRRELTNNVTFPTDLNGQHD